MMMLAAGTSCPIMGISSDLLVPMLAEQTHLEKILHFYTPLLKYEPSMNRDIQHHHYFHSAIHFIS